MRGVVFLEPYYQDYNIRIVIDTKGVEQMKQISLTEQFGVYKPTIKTIEYINDDPSQGIKYDWDLIFKEYNKLGIPSKFFKVSRNHTQNARYSIDLSTRKIGKTTGWLLLGMTMYRLYGTGIVYQRRTEDELNANFAMDLISTIRGYNHGEYIKKLTDGKYNDIYYHWRAFYYCEKDENGSIINKSDRPFCKMIALERWQDYKSSLNLPEYDLFIYDEFIVKGALYNKDEFIGFMNNIDTVFRHRNSGHIAMLANTITNTNLYFDELSIGRLVKKMKSGDRKLFQSPKGTKIYVEFVDAKITHSQQNKLHNELYFGWDNPAMPSITGEGDWTVEIAPHINENNEGRVIYWNNIVIEFSPFEYLRVKYVYDDVNMHHLEITPATKYYDNDILLGLDRIKHTHFGFGSERIENLFRKMEIANRIYYGTNEMRDLFHDYLVRSALEKRLL